LVDDERECLKDLKDVGHFCGIKQAKPHHYHKCFANLHSNVKTHKPSCDVLWEKFINNFCLSHLLGVNQIMTLIKMLSGQFWSL